MPEQRLAIIFDLDGTLADITERQKYLLTIPKNWPVFHKGVENDKPFYDIIRLAKALANHYTLFICSGRDGGSLQETIDWLNDHDANVFKGIYLRKEKDYRADTVVKSEMVDEIINLGYQVECVFEDRTRVVNMWRARGIRALQVAPGDF